MNAPVITSSVIQQFVPVLAILEIADIQFIRTVNFLCFNILLVLCQKYCRYCVTTLVVGIFL